MLKYIAIAILSVFTASAASAQETPYQEAWRLADEARAAGRAGDQAGALELYRRALDLAPDTVAIRRDYATVLGWMQRYHEASEEFSIVTGQEPNQPVWAIREIANAHFFGGNEAGALAAFDQLIAQGYYEAPILTRRGLTLLRLGRNSEAEQQYRQALGWYPESEPAAAGLGRALAAQGQTEAAYTLAVTWGHNAKPDSEIRLLAAEMLTAMGRKDEAAALYAQIPAERRRELGIADPAAAEAAEERPPTRQELTPPIGTSSAYAGASAQELRERGVQAARDGQNETGLSYLEQALSIDPQNTDLRIDYAILLGWAERYPDALTQFALVMQEAPDQPAWARSELARNQLFGGQTASALATLNGLLAAGTPDIATLSRRGLALRWLGRSEEAEATYRRLSHEFPDSPEGPRGIVQTLADRNHLADALDQAEAAIEKFPGDTELKVHRVQVLNWAGRHIQARKALDDLLPEYRDVADVMHHRTLAARWASRPREAFELALEFKQKHPNDPQAARLLRDLSYEYGASVQGDAEMVSDSAGYSLRSTAQTVTIPLSVSHHLSFMREHRSYEDTTTDPHDLSWSRYGLGWTGVVGHRVTASANASSIDYSLPGMGRRMMGDASVSALLTDHVTVAAGVGVSPAQTLPALQERLMGRHVWGEVRVRPTLKMEAGAQYMRRSFAGQAVRQTAEFSAFRMVSQRGGHKIRLGGRSQWMWHDRYSPLFWSPEFFYTQLASIRAEGSLPGGLDYATEAGSGIQHEAGYGKQIPLVTTVELAKKLQPNLWLRVKAGYSNSSIDRINTGEGGYRFRYFSAGLDFRLGKKG